MTVDPLMTVKDVQHLTGLSGKAVRSAIHQGELRASFRCNRYLIGRQDYLDWIEQGRVHRGRAQPEPVIETLIVPAVVEPVASVMQLVRDRRSAA